MDEVLEKINGVVWGVPALVLIIGVGIYLTLRTRFAQFRLLPKAMRAFLLEFRLRPKDKRGISPFRALCTALAATVGTGNLAGVAGAIAIGGPGSIFWMWVCGCLGMVTKFAEATLAVRYRERNSQNEYVGGTMYMIRHGMGERWKWLAGIYAFFGVIAAFGVGNATQINTVIGSINCAVMAFGGAQSRVRDLMLGLALTVLVGSILLGGAKRIGEFAEILVPLAAISYLILGTGILFMRCNYIPSAFAAILQGAFQPVAVTGGVVGSAIKALRIGTSRGVFTNEAGMGTAALAHSSADVVHPVQQGLMGIVEVFLDTIVICTMTAFVILCSGITIPYGTDQGIALTLLAFDVTYGKWVYVFMSVAIACFALATVIGWGFYGIRCAQYLFGEKSWRIFAWLQTGTVMLGAILSTGIVWICAEIMNGLMAIPNLIALVILSPEFRRLVQDFDKMYKDEKNIDFSTTCAKIRKNQNGNAEKKKI